MSHVGRGPKFNSRAAHLHTPPLKLVESTGVWEVAMISLLSVGLPCVLFVGVK